MKLPSLVPRSMSLFEQLLVTFVVLVAATTAGLTFVAYRTSVSELRQRAHRDAALAAETRDRMLTQLLTSRTTRAEDFLQAAESLCSEDAVGRFAWADNCVFTMFREFAAAERATGARLTYRGRTLSSAGQLATADVPDEGAWSVVRHEGTLIGYVMTVHRDEVSLRLDYDTAAVLPLFDHGAGVGEQGEVFLVDSAGRPLTPLRHAASAAFPEVPERCRTPSSEDAIDYRGARVIRAFRPVPALPGVCVVAHVSSEEALGPAATLGADLAVSGVVFVLTGALLSLIAARYIAAPVRRLSESARALQAGDFGASVPIAGPAEVRGLGRAFAAMANDLAELVSREQAARREAESANRSKDQFLAMLSHELRTPLTAVLGWAQTLRRTPDDAVRVERAATAIQRSAEAQRQLIDDLLDVAGIAAGRVRMNPVPTRLAPVVEGALDTIRPRAVDKGVGLECVIADPDIVVHGDPQRLQQIVWNLTWNSVKFTPAGGVVTVGTRVLGGLAELTVSDTGIGIEPEFLPHVFGWFRRADGEVSHTDEGLGLGLALVRQLVELHGGSVRAESPGRNRGSRFVVTLPLQQQGPSAALTAAEAPPMRLRLGSVRVLVVDDDPGSREAVRVLLEQLGAQVATAASAADARRHLRSQATDVLISDIAMEQESGYTLVEHLRAEGFTLPAIALTGFARREDADRAYAAGFDVHLPKPVDPDVLVSVLLAVSRTGSGG